MNNKSIGKIFEEADFFGRVELFVCLIEQDEKTKKEFEEEIGIPNGFQMIKEIFESPKMSITDKKGNEYSIEIK